MVKQLRFLMLVLMVMILGSAALAQEVTLDFTENTWGLSTAYTKAAATYSDGTHEISWRCRIWRQSRSWPPQPLVYTTRLVPAASSPSPLSTETKARATVPAFGMTKK